MDSFEQAVGDEPSAPPLPSDSDDSDIAPQWVQRLYGPPPPRQPQPNHQQAAPTARRGAAGHPGWQDGADWRPPAPPYHYQHYDVQAFTPGALPRAGHGGMLRERSPSATAMLATDSAGPSQAFGGHNVNAEGSPTKTPLLVAGARLAHGSDCCGNEHGSSAAPQPRDLHDDPTRPSRALGLRERHRQQLRTCNKDAFGVPLPQTSRPFSLFAAPTSIAEVCAGLGVYLASLQAAVLLALLLSLCAIYPLVDNLDTQRWADQYTLYNAGAGGAAGATCAKGWDSTDWLTVLTIGGRCSGTRYTSAFDCGAKCVWDPTRLQQPQCHGQPPPGGLAANGSAVAAADQQYQTLLEGACALHLPCITDRQDPATPDGPCYCCQLQLDEAVVWANPGAGAGQLWVLFVGQLVFMGWMMYLMHTQLTAAHAVGSRVVGPSDYTVWIRGIKKSRTDDAPLAHWCGQYGSVVAAFNVPSVGDATRVGRGVALLELKKAESEALAGSTSCNPLQYMYRTFVVGRHASILSALERQRLKLAIYERQESEPTGQGLATFEFAESAAACIADFDRPPLRRLLDHALCGCSNATPRLHGAVVDVARAPEPSDIIWDHTNCTGTSAFMRRLWSWTLTTLIMLAGAGVQYGLAVMAERERAGRMQAEYAAGTGESWAVAEAAARTRRLRAISILAGVMVATVNLIIMIAVRVLSWTDRWTTRTSMERWVMVKLTISQLTNAFAAPVLAAYLSGNRSSWYSRGGLVESAFFVQCATGVLGPLFHLLGPVDNLKWYLLSPFARTQAMLNQLLAPPPFPLAEQHAASVTALGLAMWYCPVLPISPMIALVGLSVSYCVNKYVALRRAAAPANLSGQVTSSLNWLLRLVPLVQLVLMKELYFRDYPTINPVFYTGLSFWLLFTVAPMRALLGAVRRRRRATPATGLSYHRCLGGKRLGPGEVYAPIVPKPCSRKFKQKVAATFAQLAPAAFLSMSPGETAGAGVVAEVQVAAAGKGGEVAAPPPALGAGAGRQHDTAASHNGLAHQGLGLRGSIVAGVQGTWDLLWRPHDPDHPDDVFVRPGGAGQSARAHPHRGSGTDSCGSSGGDGSGTQAAAPARAPAPFIRAVWGSHPAAPPSAPRAPGSHARGGSGGGGRGPTPPHNPFSPLQSGLPRGADLA